MSTPILSTAIHAYLTTAPTSEFHGQTVMLVDEWRGADNYLWRVACGAHEAVIKLFLDAGQVRSRRQFDGQQRFAPLGIAPRPRWYDRYPAGLSRQVLIYDWAPGDALDTSDAGQLSALADATATIHGSDGQDVLRFSPNPLNLDYLWRLLRTSITQIDGWLARQGAPLLQREFGRTAGAATALINHALPLWQDAPPTPIHGDLKLENVINSLGAPVLLDWERFGLGDPAQEAAGFLIGSQTLLDEEQSAAWLERYLARMDQPGLEARIEVYRRILPFRDLCLLLDGLRTAAAEGDTLTAEQRSFLHATLLAAWSAAGAQLSAPPGDIADELTQIVANL